MTRNIAMLVAVIVGFLLLAQPSAGATDIYLQFTGLSGEAATRSYIPLLSYSQSVQSTANAATGAGAGAGKASCGQITITKHLDAASPLLVRAVMTGEHISQAIISFVDTRGGGGQQTNYVVTLQDILLSSDQQSDSSPAQLIETVSMSASNFTVDYVPFNAGGNAGTPQKFSVNCATGFAQ